MDKIDQMVNEFWAMIARFGKFYTSNADQWWLHAAMILAIILIVAMGIVSGIVWELISMRIEKMYRFIQCIRRRAAKASVRRK